MNNNNKDSIYLWLTPNTSKIVYKGSDGVGGQVNIPASAKNKNWNLYLNGKLLYEKGKPFRNLLRILSKGFNWLLIKLRLIRLPQ